jgi:dihydrodipicolinate synthase/N-acetylneuraminate lyase
MPNGLVGNDAAKSLRGVFIILNTPFTVDKAVDWDDLRGEVTFVDRCGAQGVVWPQGSSGVATLTKDERMRGMEVLAEAARGRNVALVLGVQGNDIPEMLEYVREADRLKPDAVIAMPPTRAAREDDYRDYFRALGHATERPVILQTTGGAKNLTPSTDLIVELAREMPNFGYVKEESQPLVERIRTEVSRRPPMKRIYGANLGVPWLYQLRLGVDGVITGNGMYADLLARIWQHHERGELEKLSDAFGKFLLVRNLNDEIPGADLYVMKRRGVFKTTVTRTHEPYSFAPEAIAEIEFRLAAIRPYLVDPL